MDAEANRLFSDRPRHYSFEMVRNKAAKMNSCKEIAMSSFCQRCWGSDAVTACDEEDLELFHRSMDNMNKVMLAAVSRRKPTKLNLCEMPMLRVIEGGAGSMYGTLWIYC